MPVAKLVIAIARNNPRCIVVRRSDVEKLGVVALREDQVMRSFDIHGVVFNESIGVVGPRIGDGFNL